MADHGTTVARIDSPDREWADIHVEYGGTAYRVRIALTGRDQPIEFPGMYRRELFTEGRHTRYLAPDLAQDVPVVDLRTVF